MVETKSPMKLKANFVFPKQKRANEIEGSVFLKKKRDES